MNGFVAPPVGGRCVPEQSPSAMASAVREIWSRPDLDDLRVAARNRVVRSHEADVCLRVYERIFEGMVEAGEGREGGGQADSGVASGAQRDFLGASLPPCGRALGSLVAYIAGKDVVEVRRLPGGSPMEEAGGARSWIRVGPGELARDDGPARDRFDVLLDLDGTSPESAVTESPSYSPVLRPGGLAILAVRLDDSRVSSFCGRLAGSFHKVLPLDRLFAPGPALPEEGPARGRPPGDSGAPPSNLRYVLCRP